MIHLELAETDAKLLYRYLQQQVVKPSGEIDEVGGIEHSQYLEAMERIMEDLQEELDTQVGILVGVLY